jgi:hypothetical protein
LAAVHGDLKKTVLGVQHPQTHSAVFFSPTVVIDEIPLEFRIGDMAFQQSGTARFFKGL